VHRYVLGTLQRQPRQLLLTRQRHPVARQNNSTPAPPQGVCRV
jgi:hypothetical protein